MRLARAALSFLGVLAGLSSASVAHAAGGVAGPPAERTQIVASRIAVAAAPEHRAMWASVDVVGTARGFVWLVPVQPGARVELASDTWFEALDTATAARVVSPAEWPPCDVSLGVESYTRAHAPLVPPTSSLMTADAQALAAFVKSAGSAISPDLAGRVEAAFARGAQIAAFAFPASGPETSTRTVRVIDDGAGAAAPLALPLALTSGGAGGVAITAFVLTSARVDIGAVPSVTVDPNDVTWRADGTSTYAETRERLVGAAAGATWVVEAASHAMLETPTPVTSDVPVIPALLDVVSPDDGTYALEGQSRDVAWITRAYGTIPRGVFGDDASITEGAALRQVLPVVQAVSYDVTCTPGPMPSPGSGGGAGGSGSGGHAPRPPVGPPSADPVETTSAAADGVQAAAVVADGCSSSDDSSYDDSGESCSSSGNTDGTSSSEETSAGESCSSGTEGESTAPSSDCSVARARPRRRASPVSRVVLALVLVVAPLRRLTRRARTA